MEEFDEPRVLHILLQYRYHFDSNNHFNAFVQFLRDMYESIGSAARSYVPKHQLRDDAVLQHEHVGTRT